ncbi:flagellar motor switch protein FliG [Rhodovulum imhoffii]|uniref:flagellar motor switch protein FliG n=1 Tax=Rhodovulum imhoffii TaxID=365340 RepID=UPI00147552AE|nr:FliG C-terminal domain-containing protein [Rhodovulum imhoffii]
MNAVSQFVPMPRARKAAVIVRLLLGEGIDLPLRQLPESLQRALTDEIVRTRYVDGPTVAAIANEFLEELERGGLGFPDGLDGALHLLEGVLSPAAAEALRHRVNGTTGNPWLKISRLDDGMLHHLLEHESAEIVAIVLSKMPNARAAEFLGMLPGARARSIALAISRTRKVSPQTVARIGAALAEAVDAYTPAAFEDAAEARMGAILNISRASTREDVLAGLEAEDAGLAERVRRAIFTFENIPDRLSPEHVPTVVREIPQDILLTAFAGAAGGKQRETVEFVLDNLSNRMATQLREMIEDRGEVAKKAAEQAMAQVVARLREMEDADQISLQADEDDEAIVFVNG